MDRIKKAIDLARLEREAKQEHIPTLHTPEEATIPVEATTREHVEKREAPVLSIPIRPEESVADEVESDDQSTTDVPLLNDETDQQSPNIEHADNPWKLITTGIIGVILLILAVSAWVGIAPISGAVVAPGYIKVATDRKTVQHQEGGIVGEILVHDGSKVKAGQTLILLKDVRVNASNELVRTQLDAKLAEAARLSGEQSGEEKITFPSELTDRNKDPRVAELLHRESSVFKVRREALTNQLALIQRQIGDTQDEVQERLEQLKADKETIKHQRAEVEANKELSAKGYVSKTHLLELERASAEYVSRSAANKADLASARQKISDLELRAETLRSSFQQEASNKLRDTTATIFDLREKLRPAQDAEQRQRITAPITGEVVDLKITTVGAVIAPREPLLDIVPENPDLLVEARVRPQDINNVYTDSSADVRLTAFRRRWTPTVEGTVIYVSADRLTDPKTEAPYYTVHVHVPPEELKKAGDIKLRAGMPAMVFIKTTPRNALQYFLDPVVGFIQRSMREY